MKKLLSFILVACFATSLFAQTIVSTEPSNKNVILEDYTGLNCQYCPDGHKIAAQIMANNPGRAWAINIHQGGYANAIPDYRTQWGDGLAGQYSISAYPTGTVNRGATALGRGQWASQANSQLNEASPVNVAATANIDWETRELTVMVEVYYTGNAANPTNKLNVALLQDHILGPQVSGAYYYPDMMKFGYYQHMHMLRHLLTGQWGVDISLTTAGTLYTETFTYTIPEHLRNNLIFLENLEVLAFVSEGNKTILSACKAEMTYENAHAVLGRINKIDPLVVPTCNGLFSAVCFFRNSNDFAVSSLQLAYDIDGETRLYNWTKRSIAALEWDTIHLPAFVTPTNVNVNVEVTVLKINDISTKETLKATFKNELVAGGYNMTLVIATDRYASETKYYVYKPDGSILMQGGPWSDLGGNGVTVREIPFNPTEDGCYKLSITDAYGDGINAGYGSGYVKILNSEGEQIYYNDGKFGSELIANVSVGYIDPPVLHSVIASEGNGGTIFPFGEITYLKGTPATYIFTPDIGYEVDEVFIDGVALVVGDEKITSFTFSGVDKDYAIHVTFKFNPTTTFYTITATAGENGTIHPDGEKEYVEGTSAEYIFTPNANFEVDQVFVDGVPVVFENNSYTFAAVDKDYAIHVTFKLIGSIKDVNGVAIAVAPNPVNDKLFIIGMYDKLEIFSISGQVVASAFNQPAVDVNNLSKGIYIVKIHTNGQICTFKVIK